MHAIVEQARVRHAMCSEREREKDRDIEKDHKRKRYTKICKQILCTSPPEATSENKNIIAQRLAREDATIEPGFGHQPGKGEQNTAKTLKQEET